MRIHSGIDFPVVSFVMPPAASLVVPAVVSVVYRRLLYLQRKTNRQCGIEEASWQRSKKLKAAVTGANCLALAGCSRLHFTVGCSRLHFTNDTVSVGNYIQMSQNIKNRNGHGCIPKTTREVVAICDGLPLCISGP